MIELELPREPKGRDGHWMWFTSKVSCLGTANWLPEKLFRLIELNPEWTGKFFDTREAAVAAYEAAVAAYEVAVAELGLGKFRRGQQVVKDGGDYTFRGVVVAAFAKQSGKVRYVVENADGILHIFSEAQLKEAEK